MQLSKNERKRKNKQIIGFCQKAEKAVEHEGESNTKCSRWYWNGSQRPGKETCSAGDQKNNRDCSDHSIVKKKKKKEKKNLL